LAVIYLPNSGIVSASQFEDSIIGAMTECNITYEAFHRNGAPRIVAVSLAFSEVVNTSDGWKFHGSQTFQYLADSYKRNAVGVELTEKSIISSGEVVSGLPGGTLNMTA
jgi:hypothetical protein